MNTVAAFKVLLALSLMSNALLIAYLCSRAENRAVVRKSWSKNCLLQKQLGSNLAAKGTMQQWQYVDCEEMDISSEESRISIGKEVGSHSVHLEKVPRQMTRKKVRRKAKHRGMPPEGVRGPVSKILQLPHGLPHREVGRSMGEVAGKNRTHAAPSEGIENLGAVPASWKQKPAGVKSRTSKFDAHRKLPTKKSISKYRKERGTFRLSHEVVDGVKKFVFFVGYARSGHSIIGTLMDAHPHVVISNEFNLFSQFSELDKAPFFLWRKTSTTCSTAGAYGTASRAELTHARGMF